MKRLLLVLLVSVVLLTACGAPASAPQTTPTAVSEPPIPAHFATYTDELHLFSIAYPSNWEIALSLIENLEEFSKEILDSINSDLSIERAGLLFFAGIPTEEGYAPNMSISVEPLQYNYTHDEFVEAGIKYTKMAFSDFRNFSRIKTTVDGREVTIMESEYSFPQVGKLQSMQMAMLVGKTGWVVGCSAPQSEYNAWRDEFNAIVRSLRILTDTQQYTSDFGFSIENPTGYRVAEEIYPSGQGVTITLATSEYPSTNIALMLWLVDDNSYFDSPEDFYYRGVMATWEASKGFMVLSERDISIQGMPAKEFIFEAGDDHLHAIVAFLDARASVWKESNAYKITYHAPREDWDMTHPVFDKVVKSFRFAK